MAEFKVFNLGESISKGQDLAMRKYRLGETQRAIGARTGLEGAIREGTPEAMQRFGQQFPIEAQKYKRETRDAELKRGIEKIDFIGKIAAGMQDEQSYQRGLQIIQSSGIDTREFPPNFDPQWMQMQMQRGIGFKGQLQLELERMKQKGKKQAAKRKGAIESKDVGKLNASVADIFGGTFDPISGRIMGLDKKSRTKAAALKARAQRLFINAKGTMAHDEAVNKAAREMGIEIQKVGEEVVDVQPGEQTATDPTGKKVVLRNGKWLPIK